MTRSIGVEEELLLVDPVSGMPRALAKAALDSGAAGSTQSGEGPGGLVEQELKQEQLETDTRPCVGLDELRTEILRWRGEAARLARGVGAEVAALATSPVGVVPTPTPHPRYERIERNFGLTALEQLTCGCHVHVEIASEQEGVAALDRMRPWLSVLIAMAANSPYYQGADTGYDSYRTQVWGRWPSAGPTGPFGTPAEYHRTVDQLLGTGTLLDAGMLYFDVRLAREYPTLEVRVADVCLDVDDAVLVAALCRGLVSTATTEAAEGISPPDVRTELLRVASWRAARSGLRESLVDPRTLRPAPAALVVQALLQHVRPSLEETGDWPTVADQAADLLRRGTGADRQRRVFERTGRLGDVVRHAVEATLPS